MRGCGNETHKPRLSVEIGAVVDPGARAPLHANAAKNNGDVTCLSSYARLRGDHERGTLHGSRENCFSLEIH